MSKKGKYIVIEGTDGSGKSTQAELLVEYLIASGVDAILLHEPGGSPIADDIRTVIKNGDLERAPLTNVLLFSASRSETWNTIAKPALENGTWVVSSRDYMSTLVYQGYGEGIDLKLIEKITLLVTDKKYMKPDIRIILDIDNEEERSRRIGVRGPLQHPDTFESRHADFQKKLLEGYRSLAQEQSIPILSATQSAEEVARQIQNLVS